MLDEALATSLAAALRGEVLAPGDAGYEDLAAQRCRQRRGKSFIKHRRVSVQIAMAMRRG